MLLVGLVDGCQRVGNKYSDSGEWDACAQAEGTFLVSFAAVNESGPGKVQKQVQFVDHFRFYIALRNGPVHLTCLGALSSCIFCPCVGSVLAGIPRPCDTCRFSVRFPRELLRAS